MSQRTFAAQLVDISDELRESGQSEAAMIGDFLGDMVDNLAFGGDIDSESIAGSMDEIIDTATMVKALVDAESIAVSRMLELSTSHVSPETRTWLTNASLMETSSLVVYEKGTSGWMIFLQRDVKGVIPDDLGAVLEYALSRACQWLVLDHKALVAAELPTFV